MSRRWRPRTPETTDVELVETPTDHVTPATLRGGTDLTGYAVDQFGCSDVRITDDSATNPGGEAREPGTVLGVLTADVDLLSFLARHSRSRR